MRNVLISVSFENEVTNIRKILESGQANRVIFAVILSFWLAFFQEIVKKSPISALCGKLKEEKRKRGKFLCRSCVEDREDLYL